MRTQKDSLESTQLSTNTIQLLRDFIALDFSTLCLNTHEEKWSEGWYDAVIKGIRDCVYRTCNNGWCIHNCKEFTGQSSAFEIVSGVVENTELQQLYPDYCSIIGLYLSYLTIFDGIQNMWWRKNSGPADSKDMNDYIAQAKDYSREIWIWDLHSGMEEFAQSIHPRWQLAPLDNARKNLNNEFERLKKQFFSWSSPVLKKIQDAFRSELVSD